MIGIFLSTIKFTIYFAISFTILSFPVDKKPVFEYAYQITGPYTAKIYKITQSKFKRLIKGGKKLGKKMLTSSITEHSDKVSLQSASQLRDSIKNKLKKDEQYSDEEEEMLVNVLSDLEN